MIKRIINYLMKIYYKNLGFYDSRVLEVYSEFDNLINSDDLEKIKSLKRFTESQVSFLGKTVKFSDNEAFIGMLNEIFVKKNYMFEANNNRPIIIDCGANIGLATIFFKQLYPKSKIICFEPDPQLFKMLKFNLMQFNYNDIDIYNCAIWTANKTLIFENDQSWGGKIVNNSSKKTINVSALDFKKFVNQKVDFLKIDIEGAEYEVLKDSMSLIINNVENIFFEYHSDSNKSQRLGEILSIFESNNFRYHISEASVKFAPFIEKNLHQVFDTQLDIFLYKVK